MNPSERIRVALSRSETVRPIVEDPPSNPTLSPKAEVESTLALLAADEQDRATSVPVPTTAPHIPARSRAATPEPRPSSGPDVLRRFRRRYLLLAAVSLVALCAVLLRDRWGGSPPKPEAGIGSKLQVEVKSEGNGLLSVHWNPRSTPIAGAREGRLVILEANQQPRTVELQPDQLNTGYVYYQSSAERLEFRLEVVENSGAVVKESVLALSSGSPQPTTAPAPAQTAAESKAATKPSKSETAEKTGSPKTAGQSAVSQNTEPASAQVEQRPAQPAQRAFTPPPQTARSAEARTVELDPAAPIAARAATATPRIDFGAAPAAMSPPPVRPPAPPAQNASRIGGNVEAAVLLRRVTPSYPAMAKAASVQGTVRFTATIDKTGHVQNLQLVSGPQMLVHAAAEAVKQWVYRPMMLDGKPSEVITQIEVRFAIHD